MTAKRDLSSGPYGCWISATLDLWPIVEAVNYKHRETREQRARMVSGWHDDLERVQRTIEGYKWATDICFDHQAWGRFDFETGRPEVAARRIIETQEKLKRFADRIRKEKNHDA